jgi:hypothetical protein
MPDAYRGGDVESFKVKVPVIESSEVVRKMDGCSLHQ